MAEANVRQGAFRLHEVESSPLPDTNVRVDAPADAGARDKNANSAEPKASRTVLLIWWPSVFIFAGATSEISIASLPLVVMVFLLLEILSSATEAC